MNVYEELKMHLQANAFNDESSCILTDSQVLLVLSIIQDSENLYLINATLRKVITALEDKVGSLESMFQFEPDSLEIFQDSEKCDLPFPDLAGRSSRVNDVEFIPPAGTPVGDPLPFDFPEVGHE